jgi:hypothetical protein
MQLPTTSQLRLGGGYMRSHGMNHNACIKLTRDICRTTTKYRIELHNVRFKPEKARRAAEKVKNREALDDYIRKWYMHTAQSLMSELNSLNMRCSLGKCGAKTSGSEHTKIKHAKLLNKQTWFVH